MLSRREYEKAVAKIIGTLEISEMKPGGSSKTPEENAAAIEAAKASIAKTLEPLPSKMRKRVMRRFTVEANRQLSALQAKRDKTAGELANLLVARTAMEEAAAWCGADHPLVLERNDVSRLHKLKYACTNNHLIGNDGDIIENDDALDHIEHSFVVRHDWAGAFEKATGIEDEIKLPYEISAFEFRLAGKTIIAVAVQPDEKHETAEVPAGIARFTAFLESSHDWWVPLAGSEQNKDDKLVDFLWKQIRAICIALDAEVATTEVVRAPANLNEKRVAKGKPPICEYRIVDLAKRHRIANPLKGSGEATAKRRMHFRRGHWRHFASGIKTWVRWCLVGDPELGFIHKHYRL